MRIGAGHLFTCILSLCVVCSLQKCRYGFAGTPVCGSLLGATVALLNLQQQAFFFWLKSCWKEDVPHESVFGGFLSPVLGGICHLFLASCSPHFCDRQGPSVAAGKMHINFS
jgi:hypothetical protein